MSYGDFVLVLDTCCLHDIRGRYGFVTQTLEFTEMSYVYVGKGRHWVKNKNLLVIEAAR